MSISSRKTRTSSAWPLWRTRCVWDGAGLTEGSLVRGPGRFAAGAHQGALACAIAAWSSSVLEGLLIHPVPRGPRGCFQMPHGEPWGDKVIFFKNVLQMLSSSHANFFHIIWKDSLLSL